MSFLEEESQSESTQLEEDLALVEVMTAMVPKSRAENFNQKRQRTSATASPGSSAPGSDESHADDEGEGLAAKADNVYMEAWENMWAKKKEFETFKENRKQEHHDQIMALEKEKLELKKRDLELRQRIQDCNVMSMDISGMSEQQQKYFLSLQDEIIARQLGARSG